MGGGLKSMRKTQLKIVVLEALRELSKWHFKSLPKQAIPQGTAFTNGFKGRIN